MGPLTWGVVGEARLQVGRLRPEEGPRAFCGWRRPRAPQLRCCAGAFCLPVGSGFAA